MGEKIDRTLTIIEGRERNKYMAAELINAAKNAGFKTVVIKIFNENKVLDGTLGEDFSNLVLWRGPVGYSSTMMIDRIQAWINHNCKITVNTNVLGGRMNTSNKLYQHGSFLLDPVVSKHVLPMYPALRRTYVEGLISRKKINFPFLLKPDLGTRGEGIIIINNREELANFSGNFSEYSVEPYIESKYDWRVFVLGGVALGVMKKIGDESDPLDFVAKSSGRTRFSEEDLGIIEEVGELAVRTAAISGLEYAGIDIIRDDKTGKFIVLETNVSGGWQNGFLQSTGIDIPTKIMEWFTDRIEFYEKKTSEAVKNYVNRRISLISRTAQEKYNQIITFKSDILSPEESERALISLEIDLTGRLKGAYSLVKNGDLDPVTRTRIEDLIQTVEKYEISRFGNFIGKDSGSLEDSIEPTAYYLAICEKLGL